MALFCCICESMGKIVPNFSKDKNTGLGYCGSHQNKRTDKKFQSIQQRAIEKHKLNPTKTPKKQPRFQRTIQTPTEKEIMEINGVSDLNGGNSVLPKTFKPPKWMQDEANDVKKELKPFVGKGELGEWFMARKAQMTGVCMHCSGKTMILDENADSMFHYSVCHLLPKSLFPSVATNEFNWIELCYYGNSCHKNYDDHMIDIVDLNCFGIVIERFVKMYPFIAPEERRRIPPILIEYLKTEI